MNANITGQPSLIPSILEPVPSGAARTSSTEGTGPTLAARINERLGAGAVAHVPMLAGLQLRLSADADWDAVVDTIGAQRTVEQLALDPVGLWQGDREALVGPHGVLCWTELVPDNRTVDCRVHTRDGAVPEVVISWLDGPTADEVAALEAGASGLDVTTIRSTERDLVTLLVDAAITDSRTHPAQSSAREAAVAYTCKFRDARDVYSLVREIAATLEADHAAALDATLLTEELIERALGRFDEDLADAIIEDVEIQLDRGICFPVRSLSDEALLNGLVSLLTAMAECLPERVVRGALADQFE